MSIIRYATIQLQPNSRTSEHINLGLVIYDIDSQKIKIIALENYSNTKLKNWYPSVNPSIISRYIQIMKKDAESDQVDIDQFIEMHCTGIIRVGKFTSSRVVGNLDATIERIWHGSTDLRQTRPAGSLMTAGKIKHVLRSKLERRKLLNLKAEIDPDPVKFIPEELPAFMNARWLNGVNQYVKIFSLDKSDQAGTDSIRNSWDDAKAAIDDCELVLNHNCGVSIVLQRQESQVSGDLSEIAAILEYRLGKIGVTIYSPQDMDALINRIENGRPLYN